MVAVVLAIYLLKTSGMKFNKLTHLLLSIVGLIGLCYIGMTHSVDVQWAIVAIVTGHGAHNVLSK